MPWEHKMNQILLNPSNTSKRMRASSTPSAKVICLVLSLVAITWPPGCTSSPAPPRAARGPALPSAPATTEQPPSLFLEDPANSAATTSDRDSDDHWAEVCHTCIDKVQQAQYNVEIYENTLRKQKKLVAQMKAAVEASVPAERRSIGNTRPSGRSNRSPPNGSQAGQNSTVQVRSIPSENQWIVSTLRVARSADQLPANRLRNKDKFVTNKKDAELERLKRGQQQQKDKTCNFLIEARDCLDSIARECTGFLQYHMYDVFVDQYHGKLRCPYANNPNIKPLPIQGTRNLPFDDELKPGIARPIPPTPEEIRDKLHDIMPSRQFPKPLGVILKPTFNNQPVASMEGAGHQQQAQQQQHNFKAPFNTRDFPPYHLQAPQQRLTTSEFSDDLLNMVNVGRVLLVPCCFAVMVALLALASLHYKAAKEEEEEEDNDDEGSGSNVQKF